MSLATYAVLSGKGGTGKTTFAASLVALSTDVVAVDCDVDAANMALLLPGEDGETIPFFSGQRAVIDQTRCTACGECARACRYDAVTEGDDPPFAIEHLRCEGCKVCTLVCPVDAISMVDNQAGSYTTRALTPALGGPGSKQLVHGHLGVAQDNSGKLVAKLREVARDLAQANGVERVVVDGPPGIGCPVHASLSEVTRVLLVTEPTPSGVHDLGRVLDVLAHFQIPGDVVVNKFDLSPRGADAIETLCKDRGVALIGRIPFDPAVPRLLAEGRLPLGPDAGAVGVALEETLANFLSSKGE